MADGIYVGMAGAAARAAELDAIADNLANAQTPGYKAARASFETFLPENATGDTDKVSVAAVATGVDLRPGPTANTGSPLDILPQDGAFLTVQLPDGRSAFTRSGRISLSSTGELLAAGHPVLGVDGEPLSAPPASTVSFDEDGTVRADGRELGQLALAALAGPMERHGGSLLVPMETGLATPAAARLQLGVVELGNAPALEAAVEMIAAHRSYESSMQALSTYKRMDERASEVGRVR